MNPPYQLFIDEFNGTLSFPLLRTLAMERRLAAILAADIAGFSRLVSEDEERALAQQYDHRSQLIDPLIERFNGRIANTAGDSLLIEFPSAVEAVRCGLAFQEGMAQRNADVAKDRRVEYRIGIHVGDVIIRNGDLLGDGVNITARLEALAPPNGIILSRAARDQVRDRLDLELLDLGEISVKNIARPVRAFRVLRPDESAPAGAAAVRVGTRRRGIRILTAAAMVSLVAIGIWGAGGIDWGLARLGDSSGSKGTQGLKPTLIVMPFDNLSADPQQDYFADGLTEDLTSALARIPGFLVAARNTAFSYKDKAVDARSLKRDLGVRYFLEGSARMAGSRMRLNAQLIETQGGTHVWAETFDRPLKDIFIVQDELVNRIVGSVASRLRKREGERALEMPPETLAAYDLTSRARLLFRRNNLVSMQEARTLLRKAIEKDPNYARAHTVLAQVEMFFFTNRISNEYANHATAERVVKHAATGVRLAPEDASAHAVSGMALRLLGEYDEAAEEAKEARRLAPNDPDVLAEIVSVQLGVADYQGAVETVQLARSLDPFINPLTIGVLLAQAQFALGDFKASRASAEYCLERTPSDVRCHESLVRALGMIGPPEAAAKAKAELLRLSPNYTVSEYIRRAKQNRRDTAAIDRWADGLRRAGVR